LPFIENVNQIGLNSGIQNKISELDTLISKSAKIKLLSSSDNLIELVNILNNNSDPEINKIVLNNILFKINSLRSITVQDLKTILDLNSSYENNIIKQSVFKKFYFFEFYDYEFSKSSYKIESNESKKIMQNDYLPLRLLPASLEFNIGINTLINHLVSKGFNVENLKHNSKLTIEMYESLQAKFSNDKISKSNKNIIQLKRYSDMELIYFKSIIKNKIKQANLDYEILSNILKDSNLVIKYSAIAKKYNIDFDKINIQKIEIKKAIEKLTSSIQNLYYLVSKIENKTFGVCIKTGKLIDKKRLIENLFVTTIE
jgi:RNA polymerase-binding transcription factor DksA